MANSSVGCTKGSTWSRRVSADQQTKTHFPPQWSHTQLAPTHIYTHMCGLHISLFKHTQFFGALQDWNLQVHAAHSSASRVYLRWALNGQTIKILVILVILVIMRYI